MRLYLDDDLASALLSRLLGEVGHDVQVPADVNMSGEDDAVHLTDAIRGNRVLRLAALALKPIGPEARAAVPTLLEALANDDADVRAGAAASLCWIVPKDMTAVPSLGQALRDKDGRVRRLAVEALGEMGPDASPAVSNCSHESRRTERRYRDVYAMARSSTKVVDSFVSPCRIVTRVADAVNEHAVLRDINAVDDFVGIHAARYRKISET